MSARTSSLLERLQAWDVQENTHKQMVNTVFRLFQELQQIHEENVNKFESQKRMNKKYIKKFQGEKKIHDENVKTFEQEKQKHTKKVKKFQREKKIHEENVNQLNNKRLHMKNIQNNFEQEQTAFELKKQMISQTINNHMNYLQGKANVHDDDEENVNREKDIHDLLILQTKENLKKFEQKKIIYEKKQKEKQFDVEFSGKTISRINKPWHQSLRTGLNVNKFKQKKNAQQHKNINKKNANKIDEYVKHIHQDLQERHVKILKEGEITTWSPKSYSPYVDSHSHYFRYNNT